MSTYTCEIIDRTRFQHQVLQYYSNLKNIIFINRNSGQPNYIAVSDNNEIKEGEFQFGFISYDYKNQLEELKSNHFDGIEFPEKYFFTPKILFKILGAKVEASSEYYPEKELEYTCNKIKAIETIERSQKVFVENRISKEDYLDSINHLKTHIKRGDIYEVNFCQEFYAKDVELNPIDLYFKLNKKSPTPFSCFVKYDDKYLLSASPERFIKKKGNEIISQPIKGTIKRGETEKEDITLINELAKDPKERSENIMIVDLVRNDLAKVAQKSSVEVKELCGIYTYPQVHQMISTVTARVDKTINFDNIINATFPMGSMTGAPKYKAMELIEKYESTKRGLYSGTVGFIDKENDFDFNVVIRSIAYNKEKSYLSFIVGGAITDRSIPEKEYEECMLKAKAILEVLGN